MKKFLFLLLVVTFSSLAGKYPLVRITATVPDNSDPQLRTVYIVGSVADIGPASEQILPAGWVVTLYQITDNGNGNGPVASGFSKVERYPADGKRTVGDIAMQAYNVYLPSQLIISGAETLCLGWGASPDIGSPPASQVIFPGGCATIPPLTQLCTITTPDIMLAHGTLAVNKTEGDSASAQLGIKCSDETSVLFRLVSDDQYIYLDSGKSEIKVNGLPLNSKINLPQGSSSLKVEDKLTGVTAEGAHSGTNVLVMEFY